MRYSLLFTLIIALWLNFNPVLVRGQQNTQEDTSSNNKKAMNGELLRHVVLINFKENASDKEITKVQKAFSALPDKIPEIKDYEWGENNSPEGLNKGFTHCFFVSFESEEDRAVYLPHPVHKAFVKVLEPHMEDVLVVDYWANEK